MGPQVTKLNLHAWMQCISIYLDYLNLHFLLKSSTHLVFQILGVDNEALSFRIALYSI